MNVPSGKESETRSSAVTALSPDPYRLLTERNRIASLFICPHSVDAGPRAVGGGIPRETAPRGPFRRLHETARGRPGAVRQDRDPGYGQAYPGPTPQTDGPGPAGPLR
ncbi:hypothetical protein GCM10010420_12840 [Streptomyces glaucosporus]|uniref:Uncharacterized protein n=1 Tax=Streptomyces glaucosporus TaxID=284044 RepID=A0ABP5V047_9ACTN